MQIYSITWAAAHRRPKPLQCRQTRNTLAPKIQEEHFSINYETLSTC